eukprot:13728981-Alexandrium_andersonii.AAC.1
MVVVVTTIRRSRCNISSNSNWTREVTAAMPVVGVAVVVGDGAVVVVTGVVVAFVCGGVGVGA